LILVKGILSRPAWRPTSPHKSDFAALGRIVVAALDARAQPRDAEGKTR
jgi:hypothetical protein